MGNLPKAKCPTETILVDGTAVELTGLTRGQLHALNRSAEDPQVFEAVLVGFGCGVTQAEAAAWLEEAGSEQAQPIIDKLMELSGLGDAPKDSRSESTPGSSTDSISS